MTAGGLGPDDAARIADAVDEIERNVDRLRSLQELSREEYSDPSNLETREAVERKFVKQIAAVLDVAETILRAEGEAVPDRRKETIARLHDVGVIDEDLSKELREAVGFRDVLAHTYGPVVNDHVVYDALQNSLDRYVRFVTAVQAYLDEVVE